MIAAPFSDATAPPWASEWGIDAYGRYADFELRGVVQRMRWIAPGGFWMGSPDTEAERLKNETRHFVTLTEGYWLADTACTQALWQAVMGDNPSGFKGPDLPVETVSHDDCQEFLRRLNAAHPLLELRLSTEAEWEYACRAGTETPFSFGRTITTAQVNYDGNHPYGRGKRGEYRQTTVAVKMLPPNAWGLYQMHGNVWEWCADWYGEFPTGEPQVDPTGPEKGPDRVLRGGSWSGIAQFARSAQRDVAPPEDRFDFIGFRLARGR